MAHQRISARLRFLLAAHREAPLTFEELHKKIEDLVGTPIYLRAEQLPPFLKGYCHAILNGFLVVFDPMWQGRDQRITILHEDEHIVEGDVSLTPLDAEEVLAVVRGAHSLAELKDLVCPLAMGDSETWEHILDDIAEEFEDNIPSIEERGFTETIDEFNEGRTRRRA